MNTDKRNASNDGTKDILRTIARANGMMLQGDIPGAESVLDEVIVGVRQLMAERDALRAYKPAVAALVPNRRYTTSEDGWHIAFNDGWNACIAAILATAPSHSQQTEQKPTNVWETALIEAAHSVVQANRGNTSLLAYRIDELRSILDDADLPVPADKPAVVVPEEMTRGNRQVIEFKKIGQNGFNYAVFRNGRHINALAALANGRWEPWNKDEKLSEAEAEQIKRKLDYLNQQTEGE